IKVPGIYTVKLDIPLGIHLIFHVILLKQALEDPLPLQQRTDYQPPAVISETDDEEEYQMEKIFAYKLFVRRHPKLHVKWVGYARPTWEPLSAFLDTAVFD